LLERDAILHAASLQDHVISLGGGAVMNEDNWKIIKESGDTICLSYPPKIIESRLARKSDRPLVQEKEESGRLARITDLLGQRQARYSEADLVFHLNHEIEPENVADALAGYLGLFR
jgi:shikimate kinase